MAHYLNPAKSLPIGLHLSGEAETIRKRKDAVRQAAMELKLRRMRFLQQLSNNRLNTMVEDKLVGRQCAKWYPRLAQHVRGVVEHGNQIDPVDAPRTVVTEEGEDARFIDAPVEHPE